MGVGPPGFWAAKSSWIWTGVAFALIVAAAGAWLALWGAPRERERLVEHWRDQLTAMADDRHDAIESYISERLDDATLVATFPTVVGRLHEHAGAATQSGPAGEPRGRWRRAS